MRRCLFVLLLILAACTPLRESGTQLPTDAPSATLAATRAVPATAVPATRLPTAPTVPPSASAAAASSDALAQLALAIPQPRDQLALGRAFRRLTTPTATPGVRHAPRVGDTESFWVSDQVDGRYNTVTAELAYAGPVALMYVDTRLPLDPQAVERAAKIFEEQIYPRDQALFGSEGGPEHDGATRLTILNTPVQGVAGYFSSSDEVPRALNRFSNERKMFVMNPSAAPIDSPAYLQTLAHELQHMIEQYQQLRSPSWFNEGMSMLAADLNGYHSDSYAHAYLHDPNIQLTDWASGAASIPHYGASQLFLRYFMEQYGGEQILAELIRADAGNNLEAFVPIAQRTRPGITRFAELVADWAVANALNDPAIADGRFAYTLLPITVSAQPVSGSGAGEVAQFGAHYLQLPPGPSRLTFTGDTTALLTGARPASGDYAWWSNRGDESVTTLTRAFDLSNLTKATLTFDAWYELEYGYDYGFISVSTDGGTTWTPLAASTTTNDDPQGQNFGAGFSGVSGAPGADPTSSERGRWVQETVDLSPYAGHPILVRFWSVSDTALNYPGLMIDNLRISELNYADDAEHGDGGWQATGFARTTGELPQCWQLRLVRNAPQGATVEPIAVDAAGQAVVQLADGENGMLVIVPCTPFTSEPAHYRYSS